MSPASKSALINRRLYRALLRAAKPFTPPSPQAAVLSCLLHRSFMPLSRDEVIARRRRHSDNPPSDDDPLYPLVDDEDGPSSPQRHDAHFLLFRRLVWTVFSDGHDYTAGSVHSRTVPNYQVPKQVHDQPCKLREIIRQEFQVPDTQMQDYIVGERGSGKLVSYLSGAFPLKARRDAAFLALRRLNEKLAWADQLAGSSSSPPSLKQSANNVEPLWTAMEAAKRSKESVSSHITPGIYLVAHPHLTGFFRQTVICILQHGGLKEEEEDDDEERGTYGLVVNRPSINEATGRNRTLADVLNFQLSASIAGPLGGTPMNDGGPVNMPSIQMLHSDTASSETENEESIGGTSLPSVRGPGDEKIVCYQGDIMKAAMAVASGKMDRDDVSFFVGASCWYPGQLENEIRQGCWLLCKGPPEIALSGVCVHERTEEGEPRQEADLWLSMMSAFGEDEANLAHLMRPSRDDDEFGNACDDFDS